MILENLLLLMVSSIKNQFVNLGKYDNILNTSSNTYSDIVMTRQNEHFGLRLILGKDMIEVNIVQNVKYE